jgi:hypothetical protein
VRRLGRATYISETLNQLISGRRAPGTVCALHTPTNVIPRGVEESNSFRGNAIKINIKRCLDFARHDRTSGGV